MPALRILIIVLTVAALAAPQMADAQRIDYRQRADDLVAISGVFGTLHHIRRTCEPRRELEVWRNRMRQLVELEEPQPALRNQMVAAFNQGFRAAESAFPRCDRDARNHAAAAAAEGEAIAARLTAPLYDTLAVGGDGARGHR